VILCPNGHQNEDGASFCSVCHAYLGWEGGAPPGHTTGTAEAPTPGVSVSLERDRSPVEPGDEATCAFTVRNTGTIVDQYACVLDAPIPWVVVEPSSVSLLPDAQTSGVVRFRPPRSTEPRAGANPFKLRVVSSVDAAVSAYASGVADVASFVDVSTAMVPRTSAGSRAAQHSVSLVNRGNDKADVELSASDQEGQLALDVVPAAVSIDPGAQASAKLQARPKPILLGRPRRHAFQLLVAVNGAPFGQVDGAMMQEPILPSWLIALFAVIVGLIAIWGSTGLVWGLLLAALVPLVKRLIAKRYVEPAAQTGAVPTEGAAQAGPYLGISATLDPGTSEGRRVGDHVLGIANQSGSQFIATLTGSDRAGDLAFEIVPPALTIPPGSAGAAAVRVHPRKRIFVRGAQHRPFQIVVAPAGSVPFAIDGMMIQDRLIPWWLMPFTGLAVIIVLLAALVILLIFMFVVINLVFG
jgi:hypothetical protein